MNVGFPSGALRTRYRPEDPALSVRPFFAMDFIPGASRSRIQRPVKVSRSRQSSRSGGAELREIFKRSFGLRTAFSRDGLIEPGQLSRLARPTSVSLEPTRHHIGVKKIFALGAERLDRLLMETQ